MTEADYLKLVEQASARLKDIAFSFSTVNQYSPQLMQIAVALEHATEARRAAEFEKPAARELKAVSA